LLGELPVEPTRADVPRSPANISTLQQLARLLDAAVRIPGTNIRFGLDAILGLIPGAGDIAGGILSSFIILKAANLGAPRSVIARMVMNVAVDSIVGAVPILGDLFDVGWKSNTRNAALLEQYASAPAATRRTSRLTVAAAVAAVLLIVVAMIAFVVMIVRGLENLAT
jgi:hypothetical protein